MVGGFELQQEVKIDVTLQQMSRSSLLLHLVRQLVEGAQCDEVVVKRQLVLPVVHENVVVLEQLVVFQKQH